jgi:hypothetical protein
VLADFATHHSATPDAVEATYWRALFRMDPTNRRTSLSTAMLSLDSYLADSRPRQHVAEAMVLRRIAGQLDGLNRASVTASTQAKEFAAAAKEPKTQPTDVRPDAAKTTEVPSPADLEIKRLKDELAKANAELERIRRRLAPPPKP